MRRYCVALATISLLDAWLTTNDVPGMGPPTGAAASLVPLAFVLIGDFRSFLFIESAKPDGTLAASVDASVGLDAARATGITARRFPVGLERASHPVLRLRDAIRLAVGWLGAAVSSSPQPCTSVDAAGDQVVIAYYALWAAADAIIPTTGADTGFRLRVLPNVLYYGGLIPAIAWAAPRTPMP